MKTLPERIATAAAYVASLPADVPEPTIQVAPWSSAIDVKWHLSTTDNVTDQRQAAIAIRRTLGGTWDKGVGSGDTLWLESVTEHDGVAINLTVFVDRSQVCERIVTHESVLIPAMPAEPERTDVVERVEWRCDPLLTAENLAAVPA